MGKEKCEPQLVSALQRDCQVEPGISYAFLMKKGLPSNSHGSALSRTPNGGYVQGMVQNLWEVEDLY